MASFKQLEIELEDRNPQKWCVPLTENVFGTFMSKGSPTVQAVFGDGALFSPLLFGKFFDPSDAFPLWEFESEILLSKLRSTGQSTVDWSETGSDYALKAELPGIVKNSIKVSVEDGKVVEISGTWKQQQQQKESKMTKDWRSGHWWEEGCVRRLELPEDVDWRKMEASLNNDTVLEIRIPKKCLDGEKVREKDEAKKESQSV